MIRRPPRPTRLTPSFPTRRSSDLQMVLVVAHAGLSGPQRGKRRCRVEGDGAVGIAILAVHAVMQRNSHKDAGIARLGDIQPLLPYLRRDGDRKSTRLNSSH